MELKTLKDLESDGGYMREMIVESKKLKAEAVNHIKVIEEVAEIKERDLDFLHEITNEEACAIVSYIIWNNNLTKEDLK